MLDLDVFCPRKFFIDEVLLYLVVYVDKQTDEYDDSEESQRIQRIKPSPQFIVRVLTNPVSGRNSNSANIPYTRILQNRWINLSRLSTQISMLQ